MNAPTRDDGFFTETLATRDPALFAAMTSELGRQRHEIELIASENIVSAAAACDLTSKLTGAGGGGCTITLITPGPALSMLSVHRVLADIVLVSLSLFLSLSLCAWLQM